MNKRVILVIIAVVLAIAGFLYFTEPAEETTADPSNHTYSQGSTGIVLTEYGDFQCPACAQYYPLIKEIKETYKDKVTFQFRNLPLEELHKNARAAARAAEAANIQGKFWEMHDYLFENQAAWQDANDPLGIFESYAQAIGVPDIEKFKTDMRGSEVNAIISADIAAFKDTGAEKSTPVFFLDGKELEDAIASLDYFKKVLDDAIAAKTGTSNDTDATAPEEQSVPEGSEEPGTPAQ